MGTKPAPFVGFEEPKNDINAYTWKERIEALSDSHPNKWAKYGPFASSKTANNIASKIRSVTEHTVVTSVESNDDKYYLFIKVTPNGV